MKFALKSDKIKKKKKKKKNKSLSAESTPSTVSGLTINPNDFVLVKDGSIKKPVLAKVLKVKGLKIQGLLSYDRIALDGEESFKFECDISDVVANLGPNPAFGKVYGCDIEPFYQLIRTDLSDHKVAVMVDLSKKEQAKIEEAFVNFHKIAKKNKFLKHFRQIRFVIRPGMNSVAGTWSMAKDGSEKIDLYVPRSDAAEKKLSYPYEYIIAHEAGHHIWNRYFEESEKAVWIALHRKGLALEETNTAKVAHMRAELVSAGSIKALRKTFETDEEKKLFSEILSKVCKTFKVRPDEINALLQSGDNLSQYWITAPHQHSASSVIITEYARKNSQELFAECLAHYLTGLEMPEKLSKKTANYLRKAVERGPHGEMKATKISG